MKSSASTSADNDPVVGTMNPLYTALNNRRRSSMRPQPKNTALYEVKSIDTLASIAARHNTTPSELLTINKLSCRMLFPGQILYVPEAFDFSPTPTDIQCSRLHDNPMEFFPKPGHVERIKWERQNKENRPEKDRKTRRPSIVAEDLNKESLKKFLKINVRYITDGEGVIPGVLLVTPNHLMFDPNVSDPLVIEHGLKKYAVIAPMFMVARAALYPDIVRLNCDNSPSTSLETSQTMTLYQPVTMTMGKSNSLHDHLEPTLQTLLMHSHSESEVDHHFHSEYLRLQVHKPLSSISESMIDLESNHNNMHPGEEVAEATEDEMNKVTSECELASEPQETAVTSDHDNADESPHVSILTDAMPRPSQSYDNSHMYLCLRMGKPVRDLPRKIPSAAKDLGNKVKPEYWFSIPKTRVDSLYWFFLRFVPEKYGDIMVCNLEDLGFKPLEEGADDEYPEPPPAHVLQQRRLTWSFPWKLKKCKETKDSPPNLDIEQDLDLKELELNMPELMSESSILNEEHIRMLNQNVPTRLVGSMWNLIYSTGLHGFSLQTMYREMTNIDGHVLIVIQNSTNNIFGAVLSHPLKISDHFYGTGESFLFTFFPEFKCYSWTGENNYVIKGNTGSFAIGASEGQFGLWLDDDLFHGCTKECKTFDNECLSEEEDFFVKSLEAWTFE